MVHVNNDNGNDNENDNPNNDNVNNGNNNVNNTNNKSVGASPDNCGHSDMWPNTCESRRNPNITLFVLSVKILHTPGELT